MNVTLSSLQQRFQAFILGAPNAPDAQDMAPLVAQRPGLTTAERLSIYHNAYRVRLREALRESYDKTHAYLGDELFDAASSLYIASQPSTTSNLRWYGAQFPAFLAQYLPQHPVLAELATFEWALGLAFDAADQSELTLAALAGIAPGTWADIGFACQASVQFLNLHSNCVAIWLALGEEETPPEASWLETAQPWLVWRKNLQAHFRSLGAAELQALSDLQAGHSFAEVCATIAEQHPDATSQIGQWLRNWCSDAVLQGMTTQAS